MSNVDQGLKDMVSVLQVHAEAVSAVSVNQELLLAAIKAMHALLSGDSLGPEYCGYLIPEGITLDALDALRAAICKAEAL